MVLVGVQCIYKRVNWWTRSLRLTRVDGVGRYTVYIDGIACDESEFSGYM